MSDPTEHPRRRLYGRSAGKPLSARQAGRVEELLPAIGIPQTPPAGLVPAALFPDKREVWLEIGFGGGEHLTGQASMHPDVGFLCAEPFLDGVAKALAGIEEQGLSNIRMRRGDGRLLVDQLAPATIARVFILFPDPWPKTRHRKRRIVLPEFVAGLARILKPGGGFRFATDWADYAERALADTLREGQFRWQAEAANDWRTPPADHVSTRYQMKRLGDCAPVFLDFVRI
jgi:tRNA (guanine-N7-)-methyltransferase